MLYAIINIIMPDTTYTYLIRAGNRFKIGQSRQPITRMKQLQTASAEKIKLLGYSNRVSEKQLHELYKNKKVLGEWYKLSQKDVQQILQLFGTQTHNSENLEQIEQYKDFVITFGKYKGVPLIDMKSKEQQSYIKWVVKQKLSNKFMRKAFEWWRGECLILNNSATE